MKYIPVFMLMVFMTAPGFTLAADFGFAEERKSGAFSMDEFAKVKPGLLLAPAAPETAENPADPTAIVITQELASTEKPLTFDEIIREYSFGNYAKILPSLELLVKNGQHGAEELLGIMYKSGYGVKKDVAKGFNLLALAAEANRPLAQHHLGVMYYTGVGVPAPDMVVSLMWLHIAIAHYPTGPERTRAIQDRDNVLVRLSRREKERALDMAREWLTKKGEGHLLDLQ